MSDLLNQWNEHIIRGNQLSRELEDIGDLLEKAKEADICFSSGSNGATFIRVLSPEKMQELKESALIAVMKVRDEKEAELEKLMGARKPAIINPVFEAAVREMVQSAKKPDPVKEKLAGILQSEADRIAEPDNKSLDKYPARKAHKKKYPDGMTVEAVSRMYIDEGKPSSSIAKHFSISTKEVQNFMTINKIRRNPKKPAETERP